MASREQQSTYPLHDAILQRFMNMARLGIEVRRQQALLRQDLEETNEETDRIIELHGEAIGSWPETALAEVGRRAATARLLLRNLQELGCADTDAAGLLEPPVFGPGAVILARTIDGDDSIERQIYGPQGYNPLAQRDDGYVSQAAGCLRQPILRADRLYLFEHTGGLIGRDYQYVVPLFEPETLAPRVELSTIALP